MEKNKDSKSLFKDSYFFWVEFIDYIKERKESIFWEYQNLIDQIKEFKMKSEYSYLKDIEDILEIIFHKYEEDTTSRTELIEVKHFPNLRYLYAGLEYNYKDLCDLFEKMKEDDIENIDEYLDKIQEYRNRIIRLLEKLDSVLSYIKYGVSQWTNTFFLEQSLYYPSPIQDSLGFEKILKAINAVVYEYLDLIFGEKWIKDFKAKPLIVLGFGDYSIAPYIYVCHCPLTDLFRSRYWVSFGHEILHQKVYLFDGIVKLNPEKVELTNKEVKFIKNLISKLINPNKCECPFLLERFKRNLTTELANDIGRNYMEEIICDISNTLLSGPSDFLSLLTASISFEEGDNVHPPIMVRFYYMTKILKEKLKLEKFYKEYKIFNDLFEKLQNKKILKDFFDANDIIEKLIEKINNKLDDYYFISDCFIYCDSKRYFNEELYKSSKEAKEDLMENKELRPDEYSPRIVLLAGWLKRLDVYLELKNSSGTYEGFVNTFTKFHNYEKRFYSNIVEYLSRYYDYIRKKMWG